MIFHLCTMKVKITMLYMTSIIGRQSKVHRRRWGLRCFMDMKRLVFHQDVQERLQMSSW